jgi:hypothetical protein
MTEPLPSAHPYRAPSIPDLLGSLDAAIPYRGQDAMRLVLPGGLSRARLRVSCQSHALVAVYCGEGPVPELQPQYDEVKLVWVVSFADRLRAVLGGGRTVDVILHPNVAWELVVNGGISSLAGDFSEGTVAGIEITGGCSNVDLTLPKPARTVPIRIGGGVRRLSLARPRAVRVSVAVRGGVSSLALDDRAFADIGGPLQLAAPGAGDADTFDPCYSLSISGGAVGIEVIPVQDGGRRLP